MSVALPVTGPCGSTKSVYVPVVGRTTASRKPPFDPALTGVTRTVPFGFRIEILRLQHVDVPNDTSDTTTLALWPATPENVTFAFCPGTVVVTGVEDPKATVPLASAGTSWSVIVTAPVAEPCGSTTTAYVPVSARAAESRKPPFVPNVAVETTRPSGRSSVTFVLQQNEVPTVTSVISTLTRPPAMPANVTRAFWPGTVVAMLVVEPSAPAAVASAGTS